MAVACRSGRIWAHLAIALLSFAQLKTHPAAAVTLLVNSTVDGHDANPGDGTCASTTGRCTLRAAIEESNALAGEDSILLPGGSYNLVHGELQVRDSLVLTVTGIASATLDAGFRSRVLAVLDAAHLVASGLRLQHGKHFDCGGAVYNARGATLTLQDSEIVRNRVISTEEFPPGYTQVGDWPSGGGLCNGGSATLSDVQVSRNAVRAYHDTASGGGMENLRSATLSLHNVVIADNRVQVTLDSSAEGGGISNSGVLSFSTLAVRRNRVRGSFAIGGGLIDVGYLSGSDLSVMSNWALAHGDGGDEDAEGGGGALYGESADVHSITVSRNRAMARRGLAQGGGISIFGEDLQLRDIAVTYNQAKGCAGFGGGLEIGSSLVTASGGLVSLNRAVSMGSYYCSPGFGGGIDVDAADVTLRNIVITNNRARGQGPFDGGLSGSAVLDNVVITGNVPQ